MNINHERIISYLIKPASSDCNMFCDYCFYRKTAEAYPETSVHRITDDTFATLARNAQEFNPQAAGYLWQGGEPMLMGLDFYERVIEIQEQFRKPDQMISNVIQTNAVLIDEKWAQFFARNRFLVGVSIDGPQELYDLHRFTRSKKSVFDRVKKACGFLDEYKVDYNVLAVINNDTVNYPEEIYNYFLEQHFYYLQFIPCIEVVDKKLAPFSVDAEEYGRFLCKLFDEWFKNGYPYVSIRLFDNLLQYRVGQVPESCMFKDSCGWYFVIEHNGDIFPCDFFVTKEWLLGNIRKDSIENILETPKYNEFAHLRDRPCEECNDCEWLDFCHQGCVKFRYLPELDYNATNYLCKSYKMFLEYTRERYNFLAWDIIRRHNGQPPPLNTGRNDPCFCGSGKKYKKCCEKYSFILKK